MLVVPWSIAPTKSATRLADRCERIPGNSDHRAGLGLVTSNGDAIAVIEAYDAQPGDPASLWVGGFDGYEYGGVLVGDGVYLLMEGSLWFRSLKGR